MNGKRTNPLNLKAIERYEAGESATTICRSLLPASTIKRILKREGLQRTKEPYVPKGKAYPKQEAVCANNVHQADPVVPRFIEGHGRFYSLTRALLRVTSF